MVVREKSMADISDSFFDQNKSTYGGGLYIWSDLPSTVKGCTFSENRSLENGGALFCRDAAVQVENCTFWRNVAEARGGACWISSGKPTFMNVTFFENVGSVSVGGLANGAGNPVVTNSIFWGSSGGEISLGTSDPSLVTYCVVEGGFAGGAHIVEEDPQLATLADNGGPTLTQALFPDSSAIDAGTSVGAPVTDQRGVARPQGGGFDIGAYESDVVPNGGGGGGCSLGMPSPLSALLFALPLLLLLKK